MSEQLMGEQRAAALEFLTHRREGAQIAGGGLHLLRPELVLAQFGEAFRGCFLRNPAKEIEPLRPPMARELGDLEFEIDCGRGVGAFTHSNQVAAGAEEGNAGLENRDILGMIVAEVAPQRDIQKWVFRQKYLSLFRVRSAAAVRPARRALQRHRRRRRRKRCAPLPPPPSGPRY